MVIGLIYLKKRTIIVKIDIELTEEHIKYLKWFKSQYRPEIKGYNPIQWNLEYLGILMLTPLDEDGRQTKTHYILPTGIGKQVLDKIK